MIKVVALDIYGTVLATADPDNELPPRLGIEEFVKKCKERGVKVVTASDASLDVLKIDLVDSGVKLEWFDEFFQLDETPKDFSRIIGFYDILPRELFVVGDRWKKDIEGAAKIGAYSLKVNEYYDTRDDFDFSKIDLEQVEKRG